MADAKDIRDAERLLCQRSFIDFVHLVRPWFIIEEVHCLIASELEALERGEFDRLMIFLSPRGSKSEMISKLFPSWWIGRHPSDKIMQVSYKENLATDFGREVRDMLTDPAYQTVFPGIGLRADVKAAGKWMVTHNLKDEQQGEYYASGVTGGIAGRGWNLGIIDDPLSEQDAVSDLAREGVRNWYGPGFYSRRQPGRNAVALMTTRWAADDLPGHLLDLQESDPHADRWRVIEIPAVLSDDAAAKLNRFTDIGEFYDNVRRRSGIKTTFWIPETRITYKAGDSYAPRRWPLKELQRQRGQMTERAWSALYQQRPVAEEGHIMKRDCWQKWPKKDPPEVFEIIACYDSAFEEDEEADYTARTTWGLFEHMGLTSAILIEAWQDRVDSATLLDEMERHTKEYDLDRLLIEKRASGHWLVKEARKRALPARPWLPPMRGSRNKGKVPRAHAASFVLESGAVWYMDRRWAEQVINQCAEVPFGAHDDWADTCTMALIHLRERWKVELRGVDDQDEEEEDFEPVMERKRIYA